MPKKTKPQTQAKPLTLRDAVPLLRKEALRLAGGDRSRIEVVSKTSAIVR